jgi:mycothiol synthase
MNDTISDLTFRPACHADADQVLDLMKRCEIEEYGEPDSSLEDLLNDWEQMNLESDSWLAFTSLGNLAGYAAVIPWVDRLRYDFFLDPVWGSSALGHDLLRRCEQRGRIITQADTQRKRSKAVIYVARANQRDRQVVEEADYQAIRHHYQMQIEFDSPPPPPSYPVGIVLRTFVPDQDAQVVHALIESAFARPGRTPTSFEEWKKLMMRADIFDPGLWFLALYGEEIVGACLGFEYGDLGWVRQLAVSEAWRRQGLGSALLLHAFNEFAQRGFTKAGLGVAADNPKAYSLYEKIGMRRVRQYIENEKAIE